MKREKRKTFTYTTTDKVRIKSRKRAEKEGVSLSEVIHQFLMDYSGESEKSKRTFKLPGGKEIVVHPMFIQK